MWAIASWILLIFSLVRVASLITSACWVHRHGELLAERVQASSTEVRYDIEHLWSLIKDLGGGPRPWRPFGIRSQLLEVNARKARRSGNGPLEWTLTLGQKLWKWQVCATILSLTTIVSGLVFVRARPTIIFPLELIVILLLVGSISIAWEARATSGTLGGWAWVYHRYPGLRETSIPPEMNERRSGWADTRVVIASSLVALMTIVQSQIWAVFVLSETPLSNVSVWTVAVGSLLTVFGNSGVNTMDSWLSGAIALGITFNVIAYTFFVWPIARLK